LAFGAHSPGLGLHLESVGRPIHRSTEAHYRLPEILVREAIIGTACDRQIEVLRPDNQDLNARRNANLLGQETGAASPDAAPLMILS
jgi:hypothetical protein